jgi:hypothetical protein
MPSNEEIRDLIGQAADQLHRTLYPGDELHAGGNPNMARAHGERLEPANENPALAGLSFKPTPGLEPGTPSLRVKCSTS